MMSIAMKDNLNILRCFNVGKTYNNLANLILGSMEVPDEHK